MTQIATESGLMPAPVKRRRVLIGPGERVELIVDFATLAGKRVELRSVPRRDGATDPGSTAYDGPADAVPRRPPSAADDTSVPATLRPLPDWVAEAPREPSRTWRFTIAGPAPGLADQRRDLRPRARRRAPEARHHRDLGAANETAVAHLIHLHHTDWYMLSRNGEPPTAVGALPQGDLLPRPQRAGRRRRPLQRLHRQVRDPLPHARPRGPRADVPVRGRRPS